MRDLLDQYVMRQPVLQNSPLQAVICQLRFQEILGLGDTDLRPVQRAYADEYPIVETEETHEMMPTPEGLRPTGKVSRTYRFKSTDKNWTVILTPTTLSLETTQYDHFRDFAERWYRVASVAVDELDVTLQERLGLRYVNQFEVPEDPTPAHLRQLVRAELVGIVGAHERTKRLQGSLEEASFLQDDGVCTIRHGLVRRREEHDLTYVLDFDYYSDTTRRLDFEDQVQELAGFNHGVYELFEWAVDPEKFKSFEPQKREETANA